MPCWAGTERFYVHHKMGKQKGLYGLHHDHDSRLFCSSEAGLDVRRGATLKFTESSMSLLLYISWWYPGVEWSKRMRIDYTVTSQIVCRQQRFSCCIAIL